MEMAHARSFARQFRRVFQVFFHKVNYLTGCVSLSDHVWLKKEEMEDLVEPEYYKTVGYNNNTFSRKIYDA